MLELPLRPAAALLSRWALRENLKIVQRQIKTQSRLHRSDTKIMAIVKADAYGHDIEQMVPAFEREGIKDFAVASLSEGIEARQLSSRAGILILGGTFNWTAEAISLLKKYRLQVAVNDIPSLKKFLEAKGLEFHLKLDTGMNRLGIKSEEWGEAIRLLRSNSKKAQRNSSHLAGIFTHYATASDTIFHSQAQVFEEGLGWFWEQKVKAAFVHSENSAALFGKNKVRPGLMAEVCNLVRPGLALYGYLPIASPAPIKLQPVLELVSDVGLIKSLEWGEGVSYGHLYRAKKSHEYAVLPIGYADGISKTYAKALKPELRSAQGRKKADLMLCGAICMDMLMLRSKAVKLNAGDRVVFWGRFPNSLLKEKIVEPYELNLRIAKRIPRLWTDR